MKNKIFATMGGAIAALCPWMARAETFPTEGNMLENKIYESAATYDNLGTYEGSVSAAAEYADILYQVGAGQYLPAGSEGVGAVCTAGNYCTGLTDATYSATDNQGLTACPNGYPNSDAGASMNTQCYTTCTDKSVIAHATAVAGNDYYGNGVDTCYATACDNGYHTYNGIEMIETDPLIAGADPSLYATQVGYVSADGMDRFKQSAFGLTGSGTWGVEFSYGTVYGQASCLSADTELIGSCYSGVGGAYNLDKLRTEITEMYDSARANAVVDTIMEYQAGNKSADEAYKACHVFLDAGNDANFSTTDFGESCYCQMTDFKPTDGVKASVTSAPWVFEHNFSSASMCANGCARYCTDGMVADLAGSRAFRAAVYGMLGTRTVDVCAANEISITWADADPADVANNNAGVCTYDGDIRTPVKAITKPGKTFKGWKFNKVN